MQVGPPKVILREEGGKREEPYDEATVDVPEEFVGSCVDLLGSRKGTMMDMVTENVRRLRCSLRGRCAHSAHAYAAQTQRLSASAAACRVRAASSTRSRRAGCWA